MGMWQPDLKIFELSKYPNLFTTGIIPSTHPFPFTQLIPNATYRLMKLGHSVRCFSAMVESFSANMRASSRVTINRLCLVSSSV